MTRILGQGEEIIQTLGNESPHFIPRHFTLFYVEKLSGAVLSLLTIMTNEIFRIYGLEAQPAQAAFRTR